MRNLELYVSMYQSKLRIFKGSAAENFKEFGDHYDNQWINLMFMYMENFENWDRYSWYQSKGLEMKSKAET